MSYRTKDDRELFPTRHGGAAGSAVERQTLDTVGDMLDSFATRVVNLPDGELRVKTKGGKPEFVFKPNGVSAPPDDSGTYNFWPWHGLYSQRTGRVTAPDNTTFILPGSASPSHGDGFLFAPHGYPPRNLLSAAEKSFGNYISTGGGCLVGDPAAESVIVSGYNNEPYVALFNFRDSVLLATGAANIDNYPAWRFHDIEVTIYKFEDWVKAQATSFSTNYPSATVPVTTAESTYLLTPAKLPASGTKTPVATLSIKIEVPYSVNASGHTVCELFYMRLVDSSTDGRKSIIAYSTPGRDAYNRYGLVAPARIDYWRMCENAWVEVQLTQSASGTWTGASTTLAIDGNLTQPAVVPNTVEDYYAINPVSIHTNVKTESEQIVGYAYSSASVAEPFILSVKKDNFNNLDQVFTETGGLDRSLDTTRSIENRTDIELSYADKRLSMYAIGREWTHSFDRVLKRAVEGGSPTPTYAEQLFEAEYRLTVNVDTYPLYVEDSIKHVYNEYIEGQPSGALLDVINSALVTSVYFDGSFKSSAPVFVGEYPRRYLEVDYSVTDPLLYTSCNFNFLVRYYSGPDEVNYTNATLSIERLANDMFAAVLTTFTRTPGVYMGSNLKRKVMKVFTRNGPSDLALETSDYTEAKTALLGSVNRINGKVAADFGKIVCWV